MAETIVPGEPALVYPAALRRPPALAFFRKVQAEWERSLVDDGNGNQVPNTRPGAEGHAGIGGLNQGGDGKQDKAKRKDLRSKLADIATISPVPVPHDILEEHIRIAAYFICEKCGPSDASPEVHWIKAVQQLRRARVAQHRQDGHGEETVPGAEQACSAVANPSD
ncbi:MAG: DUF2934 domain-containing protein [Gemmataceae bacterium]|nr:DUF2934 domain-containing protein [Gemmataceae bacterium]